MRIGILLLTAFFLLSCEEADKKEIYNENNTTVRDGVVYDTEEHPINGVYKTYYSDGAVKMEIESKNGVPNGNGKFFDADGNIQYEAEFQNGTLNGILHNYYADGQIRDEQSYNNGVLHGSQKTYDDDGNLILELIYDNGVAVSGYMNVKGEKVEFTVEELTQF